MLPDCIMINLFTVQSTKFMDMLINDSKTLILYKIWIFFSHDQLHKKYKVRKKRKKINRYDWLTWKKSHLFKNSFGIPIEANEVEEVVRNWWCIPCNHPNNNVIDYQLPTSISTDRMQSMRSSETEWKTYEHIISKLTEHVCLGVNE